MPSAEEWIECDICHTGFKTIIFVEQLDADFCFECYGRRFGLARLTRKIQDMPLSIQMDGWVKNV